MTTLKLEIYDIEHALFIILLHSWDDVSDGQIFDTGIRLMADDDFGGRATKVG